MNFDSSKKENLECFFTNGFDIRDKIFAKFQKYSWKFHITCSLAAHIYLICTYASAKALQKVSPAQKTIMFIVKAHQKAGTYIVHTQYIEMPDQKGCQSHCDILLWEGKVKA